MMKNAIEVDGLLVGPNMVRSYLEELTRLRAEVEVLQAELEEARRVANVESENYREARANNAALRSEKEELVEVLEDLGRGPLQGPGDFVLYVKDRCEQVLAKPQTKGVDDE